MRAVKQNQLFDATAAAVSSEGPDAQMPSIQRHRGYRCSPEASAVEAGAGRPRPSLARRGGHQAAQPGNYAAGRVELDPGDVEEALNAAAAIGDDQLQKKSSGRVVPESFTHGTSAQRVSWFRRGMERGDPKACDTFGNPQ